MSKPNFFIIGAAKAATTSLASILEQHPQAAIAQGKEPHFFSIDERYQAGWAWYGQFFQHVKNQTAIGDASTSYSRLRYHPETIRRIQNAVAQPKIIYMVRHPLERMESAYIEHLCSPSSQPFSSINDALRRQPMIVDSSRYWEVYDAYRQALGESRIKVVWFEEYVIRQAEVFKEVCRFLEISDQVEPNLAAESMNSRDLAAQRMQRWGRGQVAINTEWEPELRRQVIDQIKADNVRLLQHFGKPADYWGPLFA